MRDQFELATTVPHDEECMQMDTPNYSTFSRLEAKTLIDQIKRTIGPPPEYTGFKIISCAHDFGVYYDIAIIYDDEDEESTNYMLKVESNTPSKWDKESKEALKKEGYPLV